MYRSDSFVSSESAICLRDELRISVAVMKPLGGYSVIISISRKSESNLTRSPSKNCPKRRFTSAVRVVSPSESSSVISSTSLLQVSGITHACRFSFFAYSSKELKAYVIYAPSAFRPALRNRFVPDSLKFGNSVNCSESDKLHVESCPT